MLQPADLRAEVTGDWSAQVIRQPGRRVSREWFRLTGSGRFSNPSLIYFVGLFDGLTHVTQIELSHFDPVAHTYFPLTTEFEPIDWEGGRRFPGPILIAHHHGGVTLLAIEHGSDTPDVFVDFWVDGDQVQIQSAKPNVYVGQPVEGYETLAFHSLDAATVDEALREYRHFLLEEVCPTPESRAPYIFYNTWNHQERQKYFKKQPYLSEMNLDRMLMEIDVAGQIGVEYFVIDTGWYSRCGDWSVSLDRFPDGLSRVREELESRGMRLGLWFDPAVAAKNSQVVKDHPEWRKERNGQIEERGVIWETEDSVGMCLVSGYSDWFADKLIQLHHELGVCYFKWDAIGQYGCDAAHHDHGTPDNTPEERSALYGFESGRRLVQITEKVTTACPGSIVDFDMTERGRYFGLHFLTAGKFFLVNNGPYFHDFDIPSDHFRDPETINVFFNPGPARARVCRSGARFDHVVPSSLFLTHYLPDGPALSQRNSLASLALGGHGFWGDLGILTKEDIRLLRDGIDQYKAVRDDATRAYPHRQGIAGSSPEIHVKINPENGRGAILFFTVQAGRYQYVIAAGPPGRTVEGADETETLPSGAIRVSVELDRNEARLVTVR